MDFFSGAKKPLTSKRQFVISGALPSPVKFGTPAQKPRQRFETPIAVVTGVNSASKTQSW